MNSCLFNGEQRTSVWGCIHTSQVTYMPTICSQTECRMSFGVYWCRFSDRSTFLCICSHSMYVVRATVLSGLPEHPCVVKYDGFSQSQTGWRVVVHTVDP